MSQVIDKVVDNKQVSKELGGRVEKPVEDVQNRTAINADNSVKEIVVMPVKEIRGLEGTLPLIKKVTPKGSISYLLDMRDSDGVSLSASVLRKHFRETEDLRGNDLKRAVNEVLTSRAARKRFMTAITMQHFELSGMELDRVRYNKTLTSGTAVFKSRAIIAETERTNSMLLAEENRLLKSKIAELEAKKA